MRKIAKRHKDVAAAGVKDDGSAGPCAAANNITKKPGRADPASWPLHSLPNAGAGESGRRACYIEEHDNMVLSSTLDNERVGYLFYSYSRQLAKLTTSGRQSSPRSGRGPYIWTLITTPRVGSQYTLADRVTFTLKKNKNPQSHSLSSLPTLNLSFQSAFSLARFSTL